MKKSQGSMRRCFELTSKACCLVHFKVAALGRSGLWAALAEQASEMYRFFLRKEKSMGMYPKVKENCGRLHEFRETLAILVGGPSDLTGLEKLGKLLQTSCKIFSWLALPS